MINYYGLSFIGRRSNNQDSILIECLDEKRGICVFAVADGMGGAAGGEIASSLVISALLDYLSEYLEHREQEIDLKSALSNAIKKADESLHLKILEDSSLKGMGTTLSCVIIHGDKYVVGNIGDSRTYLYNEKSMQQITTDHSILQEYRDKYGDEIDPAIVQQYGHGVTKVLQGNGDEPDIFPLEKDFYTLEKGTGLLICSDGLLLDKSETNPDDLHDHCINSKKLKDNVEQLISYAYSGGSTDNISVICIEYGEVPKKSKISTKLSYPPHQKVEKKRRKNKKQLLALILSLFLLISVIIILQFRSNDHSDNKGDDPDRAKIESISFKSGGFFPAFSEYPVNLSQEGPLILSWETDPPNYLDYVFHVYLSKGSKMSNPLWLTSSTNSIIIESSELPPEITSGILYWQIKAFREEEEIATSNIQKIRIIR